MAPTYIVADELEVFGVNFLSKVNGLGLMHPSFSVSPRLNPSGQT